MQKDLPDNEYKVFVDISPKDLSYAVSPIELHVGRGRHERPASNNLSVEQNLTQTVDGHTVELNATTFKAGQDISLQFDTKNEVPEPYLGASGHVIILDENAENYIHFHRASKDKTQFDTVIEKSGKYKQWAEFQFIGKVTAYSYVIGVK
ncbi:hypothetical protein [Sporosarcina aquimarina]|uniref:Uncharacterized protein n=1 Tax=Sporosarcina aquimarina TaxID=114975 RepID=A0ABU4G2G8_9BACL|nr:hypothetical protein [Sporosarcina aquimarina]MDW0111169.1 hypothetical protein [Sporosarcina aquimarina]